MSKVFLCPNCHGAGGIDEDQETGKVSIVCPCGFHGYVKDGKLLVKKQSRKMRGLERKELP